MSTPHRDGHIINQRRAEAIANAHSVPVDHDRIKRAVASIGDGWLGPAHYETPEATERRLAAAGYEDITCWLTEEPTRFEPGEPFEAYLRTVAQPK